MVEGIESFIRKFADYSDCYTIIGGAACDILMTEADTGFRATHDIDMIIILEARYREFAKAFWEYVLEAAYRFGWKNSDKVHFYRFTEPKAGYPSMIELFSREPDYMGEVPTEIVPIHIDDDTSSLSAILLNDDYYFDARTKHHLKKYLASRKDSNPALFVSIRRPYNRLHASGVETMLKKAGVISNVGHVHPHKFRRTMATTAIDRGMPIEQVQKLLGHEKIDTTLQYAMVKQSNVKLAHKKFMS